MQRVYGPHYWSSWYSLWAVHMIVEVCTVVLLATCPAVSPVELIPYQSRIKFLIVIAAVTWCAQQLARYFIVNGRTSNTQSNVVRLHATWRRSCSTMGNLEMSTLMLSIHAKHISAATMVHMHDAQVWAGRRRVMCHALGTQVAYKITVAYHLDCDTAHSARFRRSQ